MPTSGPNSGGRIDANETQSLPIQLLGHEKRVWANFETGVQRETTLLSVLADKEAVLRRLTRPPGGELKDCRAVLFHPHFRAVDEQGRLEERE